MPYVVNITKKEYLNPCVFGDDDKKIESGAGTMAALSLLLADDVVEGAGNLRLDVDVVAGRWAGDRIVFAGDRAEPGRFLPDLDQKTNLYNFVSAPWSDYRNISLGVLWVLWDNEAIRNLYDPAITNPPRSNYPETLELILLKRASADKLPELYTQLKTFVVKLYCLYLQQIEERKICATT